MANNTNTDINALLIEQHRSIEQTYEEYLATVDKVEKTRLAKKILTDLTVHAALEEELYYPELEKVSEEGEELAAEYRAEHEQVKTLVHSLSRLDVEDPEFDAQMNVLMDSVDKHVEEEESEAMPQMEDMIGSDRLKELGKDFIARDKELHDSTLKRLWADMRS